MTLKQKIAIIGATVGIISASTLAVVAVLMNNASVSSTTAKINAGNKAKLAAVDSQTYATPQAKKAVDSIETLYSGQEVNAITKVNFDAKPVTPPPVDPGTNPGGPEFTGPYSYGKQNNINISGKTLSGKTLSFDGCNNITINLCAFNGGKGTNLYAINLNNCTNVNITNSFGTMYCDFVHAKGGSNIKVNNNQVLNLYEPVVYLGDFAHAIRFESVTGAGNEIKDNIIENVQGVAVNAHDIINLVNCVGTSSSHIIVSGNKIRGGMVVDGLKKGTGAGITLDNGTYIDVTNNIGVNPGCAFIQANTYNGGTHSNVLIDGNTTVSLIKSSVAQDGYIALGSKINVTISNNKANWINKNGKTGTNFPGGEVLFWFGGSANPAGIKLVNNGFDKSLTADILSKVIITYHL